MRSVVAPNRAVGRVRVGLLLNEFTVAAWVAQMLREIIASNFAELVVVVINDSNATAPGQSVIGRIFKSPLRAANSAIQKLLDVCDERLAEGPATLPDAFEAVDIRGLLGETLHLQVNPIRTTWSDRLSPDDCARLRSLDLDVLVRVGFRILRGEVLTCARAGVWSFHHGDNLVNRGGPPGYWEVAENWPVTGSILQVLSEDLDNGLVLERTWSATNMRSLRDSRRNLYWKSLSMLPRQLKRLAENGHDRYMTSVKAAEELPYLYSNRLFRRPAIATHARHIVARTIRRVSNSVRARLFRDEWVLLYQFAEEFASTLWKYKRIDPPKGRYYADPFPVFFQGKYFVFFEEFVNSRGKGQISVMEISSTGPIGAPVPVMVFDEHLSYPFTFEAEGQLWMIPECRERAAVTLYRCAEFPGRWEKVIDLLTGVEAVDTTVHFDGAKWWLFTNIASNFGTSRSDELHLFHSESLISSNWRPHPMNPVISDVRSARSAGGLFAMNGRLFRPSQDCSRRYGWGLNIAEVKILSDENYSEQVISKAVPSWSNDVVALHTFNRAGALCIADAQIHRYRWQ